MGQQQYKTGDSQKMQEKETPASEKDRAVISKFDDRMQNNDAMKYSGKQKPASRPV